MIIKDVTGQEWCYIKIPRTATRAYTSLFDAEFAERVKINKFYPQGHSPYSFMVHSMGINIKYFTVVRNPVDRFVSSLRYMVTRKNMDTTIRFTMPIETIEGLVDFLYENFNKNCVLKTKSLEEIFQVKSCWFEGSFFKTQTFWAGDESIKTFRYENLPEFNLWLTKNFHMDTSKLERVTVQYDNTLNHLDFTNPQFIAVVQYLFCEDFQKYNYPLIHI